MKKAHLQAMLVVLTASANASSYALGIDPVSKNPANVNAVAQERFATDSSFSTHRANSSEKTSRDLPPAPPPPLSSRALTGTQMWTDEYLNTSLYTVNATKTAIRADVIAANRHFFDAAQIGFVGCQTQNSLVQGGEAGSGTSVTTTVCPEIYSYTGQKTAEASEGPNCFVPAASLLFVMPPRPQNQGISYETGATCYRKNLNGETADPFPRVLEKTGFSLPVITATLLGGSSIEVKSNSETKTVTVQHSKATVPFSISSNNVNYNLKIVPVFDEFNGNAAMDWFLVVE